MINNHQVPVCGALSWILNTFFVGLMCVTLGSSWYHLMPNDDTLLWDRAGMAIAFAGIFALAVYDKVSVKSSLFSLKFVLLSAILALLAWHSDRDVLPWSFVQFGSIAIVVWLALLKKVAQKDSEAKQQVGTGSLSDDKMAFSLVYVALYYGAAKVFEANDAAIFEMTAHWLSGHTLKHWVSSLVALPVMSAFLKHKA